jgi:mono/diheme cytochrome c family protein
MKFRRMLWAIPWLLLAGCDRLDMYDQPHFEPLEASRFFNGGPSARPHLEGTIARGSVRNDPGITTGKLGDQYVSSIPPSVYREFYQKLPQRFDDDFENIETSELRQALLERGRQRFDIYCSVCHGRTGDGDGMIVRRGFRRPPSYHIDRLRNSADGYYFDVMTNGFGAMASYAGRIDVSDRWAIVAYIRALQLSENAVLDDVPESLRSGIAPPSTPSDRNQRQENPAP